jgi:hypothetical protein
MGKFGYTDVCEIEIEDDALIKYIQESFDPDDVFPEHELIHWAENNGYVHESNIDE